MRRQREVHVSVIVELSIFPLGQGESVSGAVAKAVDVVRHSGLPHVLGPMGTCLEGDYDAVMAVVARAFKALEADHERVYMTLKVDARRGRQGGLQAKTASVERHLQPAQPK